jgi:dienelactone hydrolase
MLRLFGTCFFVCLLAPTAPAPAATRSAYTDVFYPSGSLSIQAYLYQPYGSGPFPVVIYNHGARRGGERRSVPQAHIGKLLTQAGFMVLVPERRGYGRSDGPTVSEEVENDKERLVPRLQKDTDDVLAAVDYLRTVPLVDTKRVGIMGWSYGGIISMFAVSRSTAFAVAVDQAGGALTWDGNVHVRNALIAAAEKATTPTLFQVAQNDRTTASITTLAEIFKKRGVAHRAVIYEPFKPQRGDPDTPPGHRVFSAEGMHVWERDALEFLGRYLSAASTGPADGKVR